MTERLRWTARLGPTGVVSTAPVLAAGVAFMVNILMARSLGPASRGQVALILQLAYFATPVTLLGVERRTLRDGGVDPRRLGGYVLLLNLLLSATLAPWLGISAFLIGGVSLAGALTAVYRARAIHSGHTRSFMGVFAIQQAIVLLTSVVFAWYGVSQWQWWAAGYCAAAFPFAFVEAMSLVRKDPKAYDGASLALLPSTIATLIVLRADRVLLGMLGSPYQLGLYVTVATASEPVYWAAQAVADRRSASHHSSRPKAVRDLAYFSIASAILSCLLYVLVVPLFGSAFEPVKALIVPLGIAGVLLAMYRQTIARIIQSGGARRVSLAEVVTAASALICYLFAIPPYGAEGAAWASAAAYLVGWSIAMVINRKVKDGAYISTKSV